MITFQSKDLKYSLEERESYYSGIIPSGNDAVMLHTCNRTEIYQGAGRVPEDVLRHLLRVVGGLESALIGETAVQGQVRQAYEKAREKASLSPELHRLFQYALRVGKKIRTETNISKGATSHAKAVLEILKQDKIDLSVSRITVIGAGNLHEAVIKYITEKGGKTVFIANRTYEKALELGKKYDCETVRFEKLGRTISASDIIISATAAPHLIIKNEDWVSAGNVTIFDLAVPRDIDPLIGRRPGVVLYNIEDIERRINLNRNARFNEIQKAERIIESELRLFYSPFKKRSVPFDSGQDGMFYGQPEA